VTCWPTNCLPVVFSSFMESGDAIRSLPTKAGRGSTILFSDWPWGSSKSNAAAAAGGRDTAASKPNRHSRVVGCAACPRHSCRFGRLAPNPSFHRIRGFRSRRIRAVQKPETKGRKTPAPPRRKNPCHMKIRSLCTAAIAAART